MTDCHTLPDKPDYNLDSAFPVTPGEGRRTPFTKDNVTIDIADGLARYQCWSLITWENDLKRNAKKNK